MIENRDAATLRPYFRRTACFILPLAISIQTLDGALAGQDASRGLHRVLAHNVEAMVEEGPRSMLTTSGSAAGRAYTLAPL